MAVGMKCQAAITRNTMTEISGACRQCGTVHRMIVPADAWFLYDNGRGPYVQTCFPGLSDDERELLISGICGPCFDRLFEARGEGPVTDDIPAF